MAARRFGYYERLGAKDKATYRKSDAIATVPLPDVPALHPLVSSLEAALASGKRLAVAKASNELSRALFAQLGVPNVKVTVRAVRPQFSGGELHGLYTYSQAGDAATIEVWMKTAAHERVVAFRTFLRTLLHEVLHHLDVTFFALEESFHTEGFFRRESSLVRQLAPKKTPAPEPKKPAAPPAKPKQLGLFEEP